jgi:hypothetical protein
LARRRHPDRWQAFYELNPADILLVVHDDEIVLADAALAQFLPRSKHPMHSFNVGGTTKNLAFDVNEIISEFTLHAPALDVAPVVARLC